MRKILSLIIVCVFAVTASAVPARRVWRTVTQPDGSQIEVMTVGDEFYHYTVNKAGQEVREVNGMYEVVGQAPTEAVAKARRAKSVARRQRKDIGTEPNLAPKGVVILANFANKSMQSAHTQATFDELCNSLNCMVNSGYPSAGQYFADQSNGAYRPQFDVFGPVNLTRNVAYYGTDNPGSDEGDDQHATDAVVEACRLANEQFTINWADYDSDSDGYVDFVYVIYAGKGQADGGTSETIWPHNWSVVAARQNKYCTYSAAQCTVGGKKLDNYAMSGEMSGNSLGGIGTLCHEFGHVMGLPDFYDTEYGTNYNNMLTPNDWDVMDGGAYGGDGHCPPNYSPWEKEFFGWHKTINLGSEGQNVTLYANGTENYQAYQITTSGSYVGPTTAGLRYYIENRQAVGWDAPLTGHGMLIWKVTFNASKWSDNTPNNTANDPYYTIVSAYGSMIGSDRDGDYCPQNTFPGTKKKTSYTDISGKPLLNIAESNKIVTLTYIEEPVVPIDPFDIVYMANGEPFDTVTTTTGKVVLPTATPEVCQDGKEFVGWCTTATYESETTAPTFVEAGDDTAEGAIYYAVFATKTEDGDATTTTDFTFISKAWADATNSWTSTKEGYGFQSTQGVQVTSAFNGAGAETKQTFAKVSKVVVTYCTNAARGAGSIKVTVGADSKSSEVTKEGGVSLRTLEYTFDKVSGKIAVEVTCTTNSVYVHDVTVVSGGGASYTNYTTSCGGDETDIEQTNIAPAAMKAIRNGQLVIIRGNAVYSATGARIQ